MEWMLAIIVKPFIAVVVLFGLYCARIGVKRYMPESRIKHVLLSPVFQRKQTTSRKELL